jgi:hypothetical protein
MKKKTSIGVVDSIRATMVARCGGAVVSKGRTSLGASSASTRARMMKTTTWQMNRRVKNKQISMYAALAVRRLVTLSMTVQGTPTSKRELKPI